MSRQMYWDEEAHQLFPVDDVPQEPVKPTNADRIRAMSDEDLAEWRSQKFYVPNCAYMECPEHDEKDDFSCTDCWLMWLKEEVE